MSAAYVLRWLTAFALTQAIEAPLYTLALTRGPTPRPWPRALAVALGASALTHPFVWFVFPWLVPGPQWLMVLCAEVFAVTGEAVYFRALGATSRRAAAMALGVNAASFGLGAVGSYFFGWFQGHT